MSSAISIGLSGMDAATARLNAAASNIANASTTGALPGSGGAGPAAYQPIDAVQKDIGTGSGPAGVSVSYAGRNNGVSAVYDPESPAANADGMIGAPNVDLATELVSTLVAKYDFMASASVVKVASDMEKTLLDKTA